ncbi:nuclear transport factor 2 family protein [Actinoallomurus vinaceus]|uniref:nuclear transport factor 2 family protein n=1 Tax=Actinoallomurus vinaceus TaxID=1080074 RepID=UPI0031E583AE
MSDQQRNKQIVRDFAELAFNAKRPAEAVAAYIGPRYVQHNPEAPDGPEAFVAFVTGCGERFPKLSLDVRRVIAEDDLVVLHSLFTTSPEDRGTAAVDIFRLEDGKIVEHWDVVQPVPETAANGNGMV